MKCPYCNSNTVVSNSRSRFKGSQVWRRRQCKSCDSIWTTHEVIDLSTSHKVEDRQKRLQPFSRDKLFMSLIDSLRHRKTTLTDATALTDTVIRQVLAHKAPTIKTYDIALVTHKALINFDKTAAAVYLASNQ